MDHPPLEQVYNARLLYATTKEQPIDAVSMGDGMGEKKLAARAFFVDEEDGIHKIPWTRYERIYARAEPIRLFAGKTIGLIEAYVEVDEEDHEELHLAYFLQYDFDENGLWNKDQKMRRERGGMEMASVHNPEWAQLYKAKFQDPFRWKPTEDLIERLRVIVREKKKHG